MDMTLRSRSCKIYILMRCTDIFIQYMEREEENRVERCRLQRVSTICCSACVHFWQAPSFLTLNNGGSHPEHSGSSSSSVSDFLVRHHLLLSHLPYFLPLPSFPTSFGRIAGTLPSILDGGRIHLGPSHPTGYLMASLPLITLVAVLMGESHVHIPPIYFPVAEDSLLLMPFR